MPAYKHTFKRFTAMLVSVPLAVASLTFIAPPTIAQAAELPNSTPVMIDNPATGVTADALPTAQINGVAWDQVVVGNTVYVGGNFTTARPAGSAAGSNEVSRTHLMSYNLSTGVMTPWAPVLNGQVRVLAVSPDKTKLYVGGTFTRVNNVTRNRVAAFNLSDGSLVSNFAPNVGLTVNGLAVGNNVVYLGGQFQSINNVSRAYLGAVDLTGNLTAWAPTSDYPVSSVALTAAQDRVVASGGFSMINGTSAPSIAGMDATSGALYSFAANTVVNNSAVNPPTINGINPGAAITSLKMVNGSVYGTGMSWYMGNFEGILKADPYTGTIQNLVECRGDTLDSVPMNGIIYSVGHHHRCEQVGGFPEQSPRYHQFADAVTDQATGRLQAYFPGQPAGSYVHWLPAFNTGTASGANQSGWTTETAGDYLVVGGEFTQVSGNAQQGLVRFGTRNVVTKPSAPLGGLGADMGLTLKNLSTTSTRLSFKALWDRDGSRLDYRIFRLDRGTTTPVTTLTSQSTFWSKPQLSWVDTSVVAGTSYTYWIVAIDPDGTFRTAPRVTIVAGTNIPVASAYSDQVSADGATNYWRMNDPVGSTTITDWGVGSDLTPSTSGVTLAEAGAIIDSTDTAASFSGGSSVSAGTTTPMAGPNTFSQELWFKTTTNSGGKLLGFGNASSGDSGSYDRHIYMSADGRLNFGVYPGTSKIVSSAKTYNDGQWHHAVSSLSSDGMVLWVDGMKVGEDASVTYGQDYSGYWRVGGDSSWSGANYFNGTIDDVAIYPTPLTKTQIRDHYTKSGRTLNLPTLPTDSYGKAVTDDDPTLFWRLSETGGATTAVDANGGGIDGTYRNGVVQGVSSEVVAGNAAAQFDGTNDLVSSNTSFTNPTVYSIEAWFNTTSTSGGKIVGFGRAQDGNSGSYDRHIYMSADGRLNFGAYNGNTNVATSSGSYNNGAWHHAVATMGADGQKLYVDGALVATHANTQSEYYTGYWRVGGDNSWSGNPYFNGKIDEVAVYSKVLAPTRVVAHYKASGVWHNAAPVVSIDGTCTNTGACNLTANATDNDGSVTSLAWDLGDGTTSTAAAVSHTYTAAGTYTIQLTATDDLGATTTATRTIVVKVAKPVPTDPYGQLVSASNPSVYWRLGETSGSTAYDYSRQVHDGNYATGSTLGQDSPVVGTDKAVSLSGEGAVVSQDRFTNPTTFSIEAWFNTASAGARIIGFGNSNGTDPANFRSTNYDRHIYLDSTGRVVFGTWNEGSHTINTVNGGYNDSKWHHVVGTMGAEGLALYVDGALVGTNSHSGVDAYDGYWRVGADHIWDGSGQVNGLVDEAAVYDQVLSATTVRDHYRASGTFVNAAPTASFTMTKSGLSLSFDASASGDSDGSVQTYEWNFGDGSTGTGVTPSHTYAAAGTYTVSLKVTDDLNLSTTTAKTTTVRSGATATDEYGQAVTADNPLLYWRLDETGGSTSKDLTAHAYDGTATGATLGAESTVTPIGRSASFAGEQFIASDDSFDNPTTFSVEAWFKTGAAGQRIIGFGNEKSGLSGNYDRHIYLDVDGRLVFGTYSDGFHTVTTAGTYNDNKWHQVVGTLGSSGMALYVDGALQGSNADTVAQVYTGYWRIGGDRHWFSESVSFTGEIDEAAVYGTVLGADRVAAHYAASLVSNAAPVVDFTATCTAASCQLVASATDPDGTIAGYDWDLGDGSEHATTATVSHLFPGDGTYHVVLKVTDNRGTVATVAKDVLVVVPNQAPTAIINTPVITDMTVDVVGSGSTDSDGTISSYTWNFGDSTATQSGATASHTYLVAGTYTVSLTVVDDDGAENTTTTEVKVELPNAAPTAAIKPVTPSGLSVAVDGTDSSDPDGAIISYAWTFGDGGTATGPTANHNYTGGGNYTITLTVTDNRGGTASATTAVTVTAPNQAPTAVIGMPVIDGLKVTVSGSGSSDPEHSALSYAWSFGDGATATGVTAEHTYLTEGSKTITLVVTDAGGASNSTTATVNLVKPNPKPVAVIGTPVVDQLNIQVDGTGSYDDGSVASYAWSFGDGGTATTAVANHTYTAGGVYTVKLVVTDNLGLASTEASTTVTVTAPNQAPVARIKTPVINGLTVDVDGSTSTDDGSIASYSWSFGEGAPASGATASHLYAAAGNYTITLTVTDNLGVTASTTVDVTVVKPNSKPTAVIKDPTVDLNSVRVDGSDSTDSDGSVVAYAWEFGDGGTATGAVADHSYTAGGTYTVKLTVTDNSGATDSTTKSVAVSAPPVTTIAKDSFNRTASRWGTADIGGAWSDSGASYFSTNGSMGQVRIANATAGPTAYLRSVSARDVTVVTDFALTARPTGGSYYHSLQARVSGTTYYQMTVRTNAAGGLFAELTRVVSGTSTSLRSVTLSGATYTPGDRLKVRFDVTGNGTTSLTGKVWKVDQNEPTTATVSATDTTAALQAAGQVGMRFYVGSGVTSLPVQVSVDTYQVVPFTDGSLENQPSVAKFDATATTWKVHLDASASTDDGSIASYAWDFGDGTSGSGKIADHTYTANGTYNVKLTVTDDRGVSTMLTKPVPVQNNAPTADFSATPKERSAEFDASASNDDGTVEAYAWEFGDGAVGTGKKPSHTYAADGTYQVKLTVTDDLGVTTSLTKPVAVANAAPIADFGTEITDLRVKFDASASSDDLEITGYSWDFGDGTAAGTGKTVTHDYTEAGDYQVTLTVTDGRGLTGTKTKSVKVTVNTAPEASFEATIADLTVTVDGTGSHDPDGSIASYAWDFGDGGSSTDASTSHTYAAAGEYTVKLTVTDDKGKTASATKSVTATAPAVTVLASDAFERTSARGWGNADNGGAWTVTTASQFTVDGTYGVVTIPTAGTGPTARLNSISARDVKITSDFKLDRAPTGSAYYHSIYARMSGSTSYSMQARVTASGALALDLVRNVSGTSTVLRSATVPGAAYAAGDQINLRFDVTGTGTTTLAAKAWRNGSTEPATAQVTTTDTTAELQSSGAVGVKMYVGAAVTNVPLKISVDGFKVENA